MARYDETRRLRHAAIHGFRISIIVTEIHQHKDARRCAITTCHVTSRDRYTDVILVRLLLLFNAGIIV